MATEVGTLLISMQTDLARLRKDMDEAKGIVGRGMGEMERSIGAVKNAMGLIGVGVTAGGIVAFAKSAIDAADQAGKMAQRVGMATETFSAMSYAAKLSDVSTETLASALKKLSVNAADTAAGTGEAKEAFKAMGISVLDSTGRLKGADVLIGEMADKFSGWEDGAGKTALAMKAMGRSGAELIPMLNGGSQELAKMTDEARQLQILIGGDMSQAAQEFNDNLTRLEASSQALGLRLANALLPGLNDITNAMVLAATEGGTLHALFIGFGGAMEIGFIAPWRKTIDGVLADIDMMIAGWERFLATITFGKVSEMHLLEASRRDQAAKDLLAPYAHSQAAAVVGLTDSNQKSAAPQLAGPRTPSESEKRLQQLMRDQGRRIAEINAVAGDEQLVSVDSVSRQSATKEADALDKLRAKYVDLADPLQKYRVQLDEVNKLRALGLLSADQAINAEWEIGEAMDQAARKMEGLGEAGKDTFADLSRAIDGWGNRAADTFAEFVVTGKASFSDLISSIGTDLVRMQAKKLFDPVISQAGDWITKTLGSFFPNAAGGVYASPGLHAYVNSVVDRPTIFPFARGVGLMGEAGPEAIMPLKRGSDGRLGVAASGGGGVVVQVIESPGQGGQVRQRQEGGQNIVEVLVDRVKSSVAADIVRGTGAVPGALASAYGLNRVAGSY